MSTMKIPAKKEMKPGMGLKDMDYIWDYLDSYVEEEDPCLPKIGHDTISEWRSLMNQMREAYRETRDWGCSYRDAFEDDPEACWGREW